MLDSAVSQALPTSAVDDDGASSSGASASSKITDTLARARRENFHVLSPLVPKQLRPDFAAVYAFCRGADDIADESGDPAEATRRLADWSRRLAQCFNDTRSPDDPVFAALAHTVRRHALPIEPFADLLDAFRQDQHVSHYDDWPQLLDYCRRSANPVGRIVLMLFGHRDAERFALADRTCTALQLVNLWQDVRGDLLDRGRVYVPADVASLHGLDVRALLDRCRADAAYARAVERDPRVREPLRRTLRELCRRTSALFAEGRRLPPLLDDEARPVVRLFGWGGEAVLRQIARGGYDTLATRPRVGNLTRALLLARAWASRMCWRTA